MKNIYIVRHGETDYNLKGIVQGRGINSSLNATGEKQAAAFYNFYKQVPFEIVYTSTLQRTHQTMRQFLRAAKNHEQLAALDEIDWGIYEGVAHDPGMNERFLYIVNQWRNNDLDIRIEGGESASDLWARLLPFVDIIKASPHQDILVCSHGRSIRALLCALTGTPLKDMDDFPHTNTCLYKLRYQDNNFEIDLFNNIDHLNATP